jgi:hypothetical protein
MKPPPKPKIDEERVVAMVAAIVHRVPIPARPLGP